MAILNTANSHHIHLMVAEQIPDFVRDDHPVFVEFIEKYYEFLAQANTGILTSDSESYYYGADYAMRSLVDVPDIDTTDLDNFISLFKSQYGKGLPRQLELDRKLLYKNLVDFYRAKGTEDSFKFLFRALYNEDIELYYPKQDMLIASGGNFTIQATIQVPYSEGLKDIVGKKIVGETSGATATVESMNILPFDSELAFKSGRFANNDGKYVDWERGSSLENVFGEEKLREIQSQKVLLNLNAKSVEGKFDYYETVYTDDLRASVNTVILPVFSRRVFEDTFNYEITSLLSLDSGAADRANSTHIPWGESAISANSDHGWFSALSSNGQITFIDGGSAGSIAPGNVLQVGNTGYESGACDPERALIAKAKILFDDTKLYRIVVRARDLGGLEAEENDGVTGYDNAFAGGIVPYTSDNLSMTTHSPPVIGGGYSGNWFYYLGHTISIDDAWYEYDGWFKGRQTKEDADLGLSTYSSSAVWGDGGRINLAADRFTPNVSDAVLGNVLLPYAAKYFSPLLYFNGGSSVGGVTQCDYVYVEEWDSMLLQTGQYEDESSHLSSKSAYLQDNWYYQIYSYDIRTKNDLKNYKQILKDTVHPAGMKMFATKAAWEPMTTSLPAHTAQTNISDTTFSPDVYSSLAGWFKADSIGEDNIQYRKWTANTVANGIAFSSNILPSGMPALEEEVYLVDQPVDASDNWGIAAEIVTDHTSPVGGDQVLRLTDSRRNNYPKVFFSGDGAYRSAFDLTDYTSRIIIEPYKKWLCSVWAKTSNNISDRSDVAISTQQDHQEILNIRPWPSFGSNSSWSQFTAYYGDAVIGDSPDGVGGYHYFAANNTWYRKSSLFDLSHAPNRRTGIRFDLGTWVHSSHLETGNTVIHIDGLMLEEYDPTIHGESPPYTPSPFTRPGIHGSNVMSWYDSSPNKLHAYANTSMVFGTQWAPPQYVSNTSSGHPAIKFRSNNVYEGGAYSPAANVYGYTSFHNPPISNYMTGLRGKISPAANTLPRPIANAFTGFVVARTNLDANTTNYKTDGDAAGHFGGWPHSEMSLFNVGQRNSAAYGSATITSSNGAFDLSLRPSTVLGGYYSTYAANSSGYVSAIQSPSGVHNTLTSNGNFRIFAMSENATTNTLAVAAGKSDELLTFNFNGRRYGAHSLNQSTFAGDLPANTDLSFDRLDYAHQLLHGSTFSIGHALDEDYDSATKAHSWFDGDIAEIIWFNEQLPNTSMAMVEGYLAHKYGIQDDLIHKDGPNAANTISHQWNFTNSQDGWAPYLEGGGLIFTGNPSFMQYNGGTVNHYMDTDISHNPIDGTGFNKISTEIDIYGASGPASWTGRLYWTVVGDPNQDLSSTPYSAVIAPTEPTPEGAPSPPGLIQYADLSGDSNWTGKMINKLRFEFATGITAANYFIYKITVHDDTRKFHPFKYEAPLEVGFSNTWFKGY